MERNENTPQHTPGPWNVSPNNCFAIYAGDTCHVVAKATAWHDHREEAMANAHLMAAAPDMLAALELAERNAASRLYLLPINADATERKSLETERAIYAAAIAKARGEEAGR